MAFILIGGRDKETFYLDDVKLVAQGRKETAVEASEGSALPPRYTLSQNYPNPFNPFTTIRYALPQASMVRLVIYDLRGARVRMLVDGAQEEGYHHAVWDGRDEGGRATASGIYFYRLEAAGFVETKRMVLLR